MDTGYPALITEPTTTPNKPNAQNSPAPENTHELQPDPKPQLLKTTNFPPPMA